MNHDLLSKRVDQVERLVRQLLITLVIISHFYHHHLTLFWQNLTFEISPTERLLEVALVGDPGRLFRIPRVTTDGLEITRG